MFSSYNTLFLGKVCKHLPEIPSTNDYALELLKGENVIEGTIITTDHQYHGKGQRGNSWVSEKGANLTFSIILKPKFLDLKYQFYLNMCITNGIYRLGNAELGQNFKIKWPNDLYYNDLKIGGILIENQSKGNTISNAVVGIGINLNQIIFDPQLPNPSSLKKITGKNYSYQEVLNNLLPKVEAEYLLLKAKNWVAIRSFYLQTIYKMEIPAVFKSGKEIFRATITSIDPEGKLVMDTPQGLKHFDFKEVEMVF